MKIPLRRAGPLRPTQLLSGSGNRLIGAASSAMEKRLYQPATGDLKQMGRNPLHRPGEITPSTSHHHQLRATNQGI
jgi:hypothetical protein